MMLFLLTLLAALPVPGTKFHSLPEGKGKARVEEACLPCHSADLLVQQRLTPKQWTATVEKMMRWGAEVKESEKQVLIDYLSKNFGVDNRFVPAKTLTVQ